MRRPTLCSSATTRSEDGPAGEGRLARVKRMLTGSLLGAGRPGGNSETATQRIFGLRLEELPLTATNGGQDCVPQVAVRLCCYIERYGLKCGGLFRLSAGNPKLLERLRASFDQTGDADLEAAGDVATVAALLKLWLRELPEAVVCTHVAVELLDIQDKVEDDTKWREAVCQTLGNLPERNSALLRYLLHFLHHYEIHGQCRHHVPGGLATVFAPLLMRIAGAQLNVQQQLTTRLIQDCQLLYQDNRLQVDQALKAALPAEPALTAEAVSAPPKQHQHQHRKRKERHESFSSQSQDRKVIRSNSEERPFEDGGVHHKDSIRRVSSHEDFSLVKGRSINNKKNTGKNFLSDLTSASAGHGVRNSGLPLHERNAAAQLPSKSGAAGNTENEATPAPMSCVEMFEDSEHERRRSSERFSRAVTPRGRRNMARRRHQVTHKKSPPEEQDGSGSSKENEDQDGLVPSSRLIHQAVALSCSTSDEDSGQDASSNSSSTHSFLQLHTQFQERERSPSPAPSPCTPPLDLTTLHQQVDCTEPLTSFSNWSFAHRQPDEAVVSRQMMMSPRSSLALIHRDHNGISAPIEEDSRVKQLSKQINSLKKKLKRYEEDFEHEFGFRPSHADKMGNKEVKKICADLSKLRKELKQLKEDPLAPVLSHPESVIIEKSSARHREKKSANLEEKLQEVEKHLEEKRTLAGRPENLEELSKEQILDEKIAVQKALLYLEGLFGRPVTKGERELMHPLYDRYRALKRLVIRSGSSKLKDSMSELATILEHETMDFTSSPPSLSAQEESPESPAAPDSIEVTETSHALWENLHSLSLSELLNQQRVTREEKKRLRRSLREFEDEFQRRTGKKLQREDRLPMSATYIAYKQAKAKLRLLEALVTKQT